jgi:hypothetical protein
MKTRLVVPSSLSILIASFALIIAGGLVSCSLSRPPSESATPPAYILKMVPYSQNDALLGYFTLADAHTNQVASSGLLRIYVYRMVSVSVGGASGMPVKTTIYDSAFPIHATNFHWKTYGSLVRVEDLQFHFAVPYSYFKVPIRRGQVVSVQVDFTPQSGTNTLTITRNISLY